MRIPHTIFLSVAAALAAQPVAAQTSMTFLNSDRGLIGRDTDKRTFGHNFGLERGLVSKSPVKDRFGDLFVGTKALSRTEVSWNKAELDWSRNSCRYVDPPPGLACKWSPDGDVTLVPEGGEFGLHTADKQPRAYQADRVGWREQTGMVQFAYVNAADEKREAGFGEAVSQVVAHPEQDKFRVHELISDEDCHYLCSRSALIYGATAASSVFLTQLLPDAFKGTMSYAEFGKAVASPDDPERLMYFFPASVGVTADKAIEAGDRAYDHLYNSCFDSCTGSTSRNDHQADKDIKPQASQASAERTETANTSQFRDRSEIPATKEPSHAELKLPELGSAFASKTEYGLGVDTRLNK
jgi:hypothetical protein